jgi:thiamine monophosphate synthase
MKPVIDLSLYLVTNRGMLALEDFFRIIRQSIDGGVKVIQLREKEAAACEMIEIGKKLRSFLKPLLQKGNCMHIFYPQTTIVIILNLLPLAWPIPNI